MLHGRGFSDVVDERVLTFVWVCWYEVLDSSCKGGSVMVCEGRCMMGYGDGIKGWVVLAFFFIWLT